MTELKDKIAARLSSSFATKGFSEPGIDILRRDAGVSLRTLYKYFPSREEMVSGALEHRHQSYLQHLAGDDENGDDILEMFHRLGVWLEGSGNNGCLFLNAYAAHPENAPLRDLVARHKSAVRKKFLERLRAAAPDRDQSHLRSLADALAIIHEGQTMTAIVNGPQKATETAVALARVLLTSEGIL
ncbi:TetR/AcrR family transcriptional regulator [Pelagibius sp. Alg239-R121]|uniref:TetR/AcrR family transcriptional regulator n=1 Tax=Pelagibius sp. Alg239-R121 TaxID=2993448 RepID=UPI0024A63E2B|nr:TetR/AcrR family transcriptional regulator [Pelagibius sp. Alg239-R121]